MVYRSNYMSSRMKQAGTLSPTIGVTQWLMKNGQNVDPTVDEWGWQRKGGDDHHNVGYNIMDEEEG